MEYLEEWGFEMLLADELARWWAAILLHPQSNCELVVSHHASESTFVITKLISQFRQLHHSASAHREIPFKREASQVPSKQYMHPALLYRILQG